MTSPSVTYSFSNGTTADATQVNQNFTDVINALTDGTKSLSIDALTVAGAASLNGAVTLGNATGDDVTVTGYVASNVIPKTDDTYDLGASANKWKDLYVDGVAYIDAVNIAGGTNLTSYVETTWTPTVTSSSGTITSYTLNNASYTKIGRVYFFTIDITVGTVGTATNTLKITLPSTPTKMYAFSGVEYQNTGYALSCHSVISNDYIGVLKYDYTSIFAAGNGMRVFVSGHYH